MHSGSNYALFVDRLWAGTKENNHTPTSRQQLIRNQFERFAEQVRQVRKGKTVKVIHNGDAIDGDHHHSGDICTPNVKEQADIHIELMNEFQKRIGWQRGDQLYYIKGTKTHVDEMENYIGQNMNAVPDGDFYAHDVLELETNGRISVFAHHGPGRGRGANEGNPVTAWLKSIYFDALRDKRRVPDVVLTGHVHDPTYSCFAWRDEMQFQLMHGIILPSWQLKTRFAHQVAAMSVSRIGGAMQEIKADGTISVPIFSVASTGYK